MAATCRNGQVWASRHRRERGVEVVRGKAGGFGPIQRCQPGHPGERRDPLCEIHDFRSSRWRWIPANAHCCPGKFRGDRASRCRRFGMSDVFDGRLDVFGRGQKNPVRADPSTRLRTGYAFGVSKPSFGGGVSLFAYHPTPFGLSLSKARSNSHGQRSRRTERAHERAGRPLPCRCASRGDAPRPSRRGLRQAQAERGGVACQQSHATAKRGLRYLRANGLLRERLPRPRGWNAQNRSRK
jgi:hypothetical protein